MKLAKIGALAVAGVVTLTACGGGGGMRNAGYTNYCTDQFGQVISYAYCDPHSTHYMPGYTYWHDSGRHSYKPGYRIPTNRFRAGTTTTRKPTATVTIPRSTPAKPQTGPSRSGTVNKPSGTVRVPSSSSTSRSSTSGSTSRSSSFSSGGRR